MTHGTSSPGNFRAAPGGERCYRRPRSLGTAWAERRLHQLVCAEQIPTTAGIASVAEIDLPTGAYVVFANTVVTNNSTDPHTLNCGVGTPGASSGPDNFADAVDVGRVELEGTGGAAKQTLSLTFSQGATSSNISSEDADIGAIQVEALTFP